jgi:glycosyltransferase involved in cell wall biosynthesis
MQRVPLTLIIPVFGRPEALDRALRSVDDQDGLPEEVIVVDDGSPVPSAIDADLARRLNVRLIRHERNRGPAAARNTGMREARTDWITFLDSDDYLLCGSMAERWQGVQEQLRQGAPETTIFGCGWIDFTANHDASRLRWPRPATAPRAFASGCWFSPGSCVILNGPKAVAAAGLQDETLRRFEDVDWFLSLALKDFSLEILPVAAVAIERQRVQRPDQIEAAAGAIRAKWQGALDRALFARLDSYMDLEIAAAYRFRGSTLRALKALSASLAKAPRLSLQLSPGWHLERIAGIPKDSISLKARP